MKKCVKTQEKTQNSRKKLKTQGENSKSWHFQDPWVPEKRPKNAWFTLSSHFCLRMERSSLFTVVEVSSAYSILPDCAHGQYKNIP